MLQLNALKTLSSLSFFDLQESVCLWNEICWGLRFEPVFVASAKIKLNKFAWKTAPEEYRTDSGGAWNEVIKQFHATLLSVAAVAGEGNEITGIVGSCPSHLSTCFYFYHFSFILFSESRCNGIDDLRTQSLVNEIAEFSDVFWQAATEVNRACGGSHPWNYIESCLLARFFRLRAFLVFTWSGYPTSMRKAASEAGSKVSGVEIKAQSHHNSIPKEI